MISDVCKFMTHQIFNFNSPKFVVTPGCIVSSEGIGCHILFDNIVVFDLDPFLIN